MVRVCKRYTKEDPSDEDPPALWASASAEERKRYTDLCELHWWRPDEDNEEEVDAKEKLWNPHDKYSTFDFDRLDAEFKIQSAPLTDLENMGSRIEDMEEDLKSQNRHMTIFQTTTFTVLAIIITALTILATLKASDNAINIRFIPDNWIPYIALVIALIALLINIICNRRKKNKN